MGQPSQCTLSAVTAHRVAKAGADRTVGTAGTEGQAAKAGTEMAFTMGRPVAMAAMAEMAEMEATVAAAARADPEATERMYF
ncbi:hypothetical protein [Rhizobium sp. BK060]|uniref:hypothetical protein n=1 Tax=Rhizobium sp. BK060 TaxID=2587096 RepID=UPI001617EC25|nr:hypothetical protein [Rhizobium sp. BK060]MBB3399712.1 hypothetical protein [Rhizobium sp. BK060]